jgi:hypothetical protein
MVLVALCAIVSMGLLFIAHDDDQPHGPTLFSHNLRVCSAWWMALAFVLLLLEVRS